MKTLGKFTVTLLLLLIIAGASYITYYEVCYLRTPVLYNTILQAKIQTGVADNTALNAKLALEKAVPELWAAHEQAVAKLNSAFAAEYTAVLNKKNHEGLAFLSFMVLLVFTALLFLLIMRFFRGQR